MKRIIIAIISLLPFAASAQLADSAQRLLHVQGALNFRDVGGYKTKDGKEVKWGKVYRSADVSKLTDADLDLMEQKRINTVIDFRGVKEAAAAPDRLPRNASYTLCPAGSDSLPSSKDMMARMVKDSFLLSFYSNTTPFGARYKPLFQKLLAMPKDEALMYHCTGGRDRTGMATAMFLYMLNVPQETIEADFVASNVYLEPMHQKMYTAMAQYPEADVAALKKAMALRPELIRAMFAAIEKKYGSVEKFFDKELGIGKAELAELRARYTI